MDDKLKRFLRRSRPETFVHLAASLRDLFNLELSPEAASHLWREARRPRSRGVSAYSGDEALMRLISDRADLMSLDDLRRTVALTLGSSRTPSRSQLFRLVQQAREEARNSFRSEANRQR